MTQFSELQAARAHARAHRLRERAVCQITRPAGHGAALLVFDHVPAQDAGVQVVAGGVEPGETPAQAALREAAEETGQAGFTLRGYLGSAEWISEAHAKREMRHFHHLLAPPDLPDTWEHAADGHVFRFRWEPLPAPRLDWNLDLFLPSPALTDTGPPDPGLTPPPIPGVPHDKETRA